MKLLGTDLVQVLWKSNDFHCEPSLQTLYFILEETT